MELYPHQSNQSMQPVALQNHKVAIHYLNTIHWRQVVFLEPIPPFQFLNIGAIAANTTSARTQATNLRMPSNEFIQIRWWPLDRAQVRISLPSAVAKHSLLNIQANVQDTIIYQDPTLAMTEIFIWEDNNPAFEAINFSDYALNFCRLMGMGYRFVTRPLGEATVAKIEKVIKEGGDGTEQQVIGPCTHIWCTGKAA